MPLNSYQKAVSDLAKRLGLQGAAESRVYSTPEYAQLVDAMFGPLPVPPGARVVSQTPGRVEYTDAEGYSHVLTRNLEGGSANLGKVQPEQTNRPAVLPPSQAQQGLLEGLTGGARSLADQQLANLLAQARGEKVGALDPQIQQYLDQIAGISSRLSGPTQLLDLDPATKAAFAAQSAAEVAKLQQQFQQQSAEQLANLYGNRVNQSSIATNALGELLQKQGLVSQQQQSDAALRELQARISLTDEERQRLNSALAGLGQAAGAGLESFRARTGAAQSQQNSILDLLKQLTGEQTQRDIATGGIEQSGRALGVERELGLGRLDLERYLGQLQYGAARGAANRQLVGSGLGAGATIGAALIGVL